MTNLKQRIDTAILTVQRGGMVIVTDDDDRENEGDIVFAAEFATPENINFAIRKACGVVCVSLDETYVDKFSLDLQVQRNSQETSAQFTLSVDVIKGATTGVSAADRSKTILTLLDDDASSKDFTTPGHVFPLAAKPGGVFERRGHTEGSIDLMKLAGLKSAAVICEIMNEDGTMARGEDLEKFSSEYNIPMISIEEVMQALIVTSRQFHCDSNTIIPTTKYGDLDSKVYRHAITHDEIVVLSKHGSSVSETPMVRVHSSCFTGDILSSLRCDCGDQLDLSLQKISEENGLLFYVPQEGRGIGLANKLKAYELQDRGLDTVEANHELGFLEDEREYSVVAELLHQLQFSKIKLLTNNPRKIAGLEYFGIEIIERVPLVSKANKENKDYLRVKSEKLGHSLGEFA